MCKRTPSCRRLHVRQATFLTVSLGWEGYSAMKSFMSMSAIWVDNSPFIIFLKRSFFIFICVVVSAGGRAVAWKLNGLLCSKGVTWTSYGYQPSDILCAWSSGTSLVPSLRITLFRFRSGGWDEYRNEWYLLWFCDIQCIRRPLHMSRDLHTLPEK